jgi:class 3 adenylate cyclase
MTIKIAELHHCALRIGAGPVAAGAALRFYNDVIGLESDHVPWDRTGEDQRINAGAYAQVHLVPSAPKKMLATGEFDLSAPHLAFAVASIEDAQAELDRLAVAYRVVHGRLGPDSRRLFLADPAGNLVELHQLGTCRCTARARDGIGQARVSGTVLFADMRGFTTVAERLSPSDVVPLLNEYFAMLSAVTREHGGTVFHMAGDGLMAGFGLPLPADDASGRAVSAARGMIAGFGRLSAEWKARLGIETGIGIGINAGDVIVGDVGAPERPSYTLIGDAVNVAARLVQRARAGEALFSLSVKQALDPVPTGIVELPPLVLRGRTRPVEIYCIESPGRIDLRPAAA